MTQEQRVLHYVAEHKWITPIEAFYMGITRLAAVVFDLRAKGIEVITETMECVNRYGDKVRYARYRIPDAKKFCA